MIADLIIIRLKLIKTMTTFAQAYQGGAARINRIPRNPMDVCTIVSIYPSPIHDYKPTVFPSHHFIDGAKEGDFNLLVVRGASWFKEMEEGQPILEIPVSSYQVAEAFIRDNVTNSQLAYTPGAGPGLFFVPGEYNKKTIVNASTPEIKNEIGVVTTPSRNFASLLSEAEARQKRWFMEIVQLADVMWSRTNGNPLTISKDARIAAERLKLTKPWMQDFQTTDKTSCLACGQLVNPAYPICPNCKAIVNPEKAKELNIVFAK
jgi:hypothetical protein